MRRLIEILQHPGMKTYLLLRPLKLSIIGLLAFPLAGLKYNPTLPKFMESAAIGFAVPYFGALIWMLVAILQGSKRAGS